jgi:hypothetical protein
MLGPQARILTTILLGVHSEAQWSLPPTQPATECGGRVFWLLREFNLLRRYVLVTDGHVYFIICRINQSNHQRRCHSLFHLDWGDEYIVYGVGQRRYICVGL